MKEYNNLGDLGNHYNLKIWQYIGDENFSEAIAEKGLPFVLTGLCGLRPREDLKTFNRILSNYRSSLKKI